MTDTFTCGRCQETVTEARTEEFQRERERIIASGKNPDDYTRICESCADEYAEMSAEQKLITMIPGNQEKVVRRVKAYIAIPVLRPLENAADDLLAMALSLYLIAKHNGVDMKVMRDLLDDLFREPTDLFPCACELIGPRELEVAMKYGAKPPFDLAKMTKDLFGLDVSQLFERAKTPTPEEPPQPPREVDPKSPWKRAD